MKIPIRFSKLFEALGTGLTDRYRYNPYVRSTVNIILLQVLLAVVIVLVFGLALRMQQKGTLDALMMNTDATVEAIQAGTPIPTDLETSLEGVHSVTLQYTLLAIVLITVCFGYVAARYALLPTRNSLQFQKRFIGNMAHEVRTPLAIIKTNTEVALMDPKLTAHARDTLTTTLVEVDRISETINNLLSFDALVRPSQLLFTVFDIGEVAATVVERHTELARTRGIELSFSADQDCCIRGNQTGIDQVFTNLVKNALNYTAQGQHGSVSVAVQKEDDIVTVSVADTGIGISRKDLYHIFQPYYRADTSRVRNIGGGTSGLGLAIVNEIVKQHDGRILVRSALNRGTTIEAKFPLAVPMAQDTDDSEDDAIIELP